jgi:DNA polymerase-4
MDAVRTRFGRQAVAYARTALDGGLRVPDEFRQLAEHDPSALPRDGDR